MYYMYLMYQILFLYYLYLELLKINTLKISIKFYFLLLTIINPKYY